MIETSLLLDLTYSYSELPQVGDRITQIISASRPFCLLLLGDMGVGKTTLTREILRSLGLNATIPAQSPTFMYVVEYEIREGTVFHFDLYRLPHGMSLSDLVDSHRLDEARGIIVEWPGRLSDRQQKSFVCELSYVEEENKRRLVLKKSR